VRIQVLHQAARFTALQVRADIQHAGLDRTRAEAPPVCLREAKDECVLDAALGRQRIAKGAEDFLIFLRVLIGEDHERRGSEAVRATVQAAALFAGGCFRPAFAPVATIRFMLAF
jgi:hypothetical protein